MSLQLDTWFLENKRDFPWRVSPTPYRVWISEVMLQQTRALVVIDYFERWSRLFPNVQMLASAPIEHVIKAWEGLGYYSRARNLHRGAQFLMTWNQGEIPNTKEQLLKIPGIGPYTAAAILSFGFKQRIAAVDGNVTRVMTRFAWIDDEIEKSSTKRKIEEEVEKFLPQENAWITSEALIELGAVICTPVPRCSECPLRLNCVAALRNQPSFLPIKALSTKVEKLERGVAIIESKGQFLIRKNKTEEIMGDLCEFPYFENQVTIFSISRELYRILGIKPKFFAKLRSVVHTFTRFSAKLHPFHFHLESPKEIDGFMWVSRENLGKYPFSSGHRKIMQLLINQ